jgi:ferredoxin
LPPLDISCRDITFFDNRNVHTQEEVMKVKIDYDLCMGDRNCNKVCPEVFQYDEAEMLSRVLLEEIPANLENAVRKAARECAPGAIILLED